MKQVDSLGRALPQGVRHGTYTGRQQHRGQGKPLPLELQCHPQRAERTYPNGRWMENNNIQLWKGRYMYWRRFFLTATGEEQGASVGDIKSGADHDLRWGGSIVRRGVDLNDALGWCKAINEDSNSTWSVTRLTED